MHIHILGICGTFMNGIALLAKASGHTVTGSDMNVYPPMSTQLTAAGITLFEGYQASHIDASVDCVIVGNVIRRGNPAIEHVLTNGIPYTSGPAWLYDHLLKKCHVLAVAGTHGKTTTSSLLAFILEKTGLNPGFLIGGVPENFGMSARLGASNLFVIEADEYDSAFFDKRSKFMHYYPKTLILNNLEYDHADIFPDLETIKQQFHYLIRTIPANGFIIANQDENNINDVLQRGCWSQVIHFGQSAEWQAQLHHADGSSFDVLHHDSIIGTATWDLVGLHNVYNALAAIAAAHTVGVPAETAIKALSEFKSVKRRLEMKGMANQITIYDDFAHHPTAIATTLNGLRAKVGEAARIIAVLEFGSYTMRSGYHKHQMQKALEKADMVICKSTEIDWGLKDLLHSFHQPTALYSDIDSLVEQLAPMLSAGDHVIIMSNSGFGGVHQKLLDAIQGDKKNETRSRMYS